VGLCPILSFWFFLHLEEIFFLTGFNAALQREACIMTTTTKKRGLGGGRGLDALLSGVKQVKETVAAVEEGKVPVDGALKNLPVEFL
jgi:hypothetical protein